MASSLSLLSAVKSGGKEDKDGGWPRWGKRENLRQPFRKKSSWGKKPHDFGSVFCHRFDWYSSFWDSACHSILICSHRRDVQPAQRCAESRRGRTNAIGRLCRLLCHLHHWKPVARRDDCHADGCTDGTGHGLCNGQSACPAGHQWHWLLSLRSRDERPALSKIIGNGGDRQSLSEDLHSGVK